MRRSGPRCIAALALAWGAISASAYADKPGKIGFKRIQLDTVFRSEGVAVGDFNHDGKMDVAADTVYYAAPDWTMHVMIDQPLEYDPHNYSNSFCNFAEDLNADGWMDLIVVDFPGAQTWWLENPKSDGQLWTRRACCDVTNNESPAYLDVDGDGRRELILGTVLGTKDFDSPERQMGFLRPGASASDAWVFSPISAKAAQGTQRFSHGLGVGDINGDKRNDVIVPQGWWEAPASKSASEWKFHEAPLGELCANMYAYDFDGDGDNDVLSSSAHQTGIWWHEQAPGGWKTHEIDTSFSQTHSLCLADINGDGLMDFVTGKRWWAHGPKGDANPDSPAVLYWFELTRKAGKPVWIPHQFDADSGVGTQFEVADINGDGLLDVATANKKGANCFLQTRE